MPQHDLNIANQSGAAFRADLNDALAALGSAMKGPNAPPAPLAGMIWVDDDTPSATVWTVKQYDGADWIELGRLDITNNVYIPSEGVIAWADVASAATVDIGAQASRSLRITGTTTINSLGTAASGVRKRLRIATGLTITHNATSLFCPGSANLVLLAGDVLDVESLGSGHWIVTDVMPANGWRGAPVVLAEAVANSSATLDITGVFNDTYDRYELEILNLMPSVNDAQLLLRVGTGAGPTWLAGTGAYTYQIHALGFLSAFFEGGTATAIWLTPQAGGSNSVGNAAGRFVSGIVEFDNPEVTKFPVFFGRLRWMNAAGVPSVATTGGNYAASTAITGLRILFSSGNITSGSIRLIGYRK